MATRIEIKVDRRRRSFSISDRVIYKDGEYTVSRDPRVSDAAFEFLASRPLAEARSISGDWIFEVTFSVNAGPNTIKIEVYDLDGSLFVTSDGWTVIGAVAPTSLVATLWWDTNLTDIDLHMSPDDGSTHCYYITDTAGDMVLDYDDTNGFGPEHITIANATQSGTYDIKVYYFADHNDSDTTTPTTAYVNVQVNGETKLDTSTTLSSESTALSWGSGAHVWDTGSVEVTAANRLTVSLGTPDLSSFPSVTLPVTVINPNPNADNSGVEGLGSSDISVINAGTLMSPITVSGGSNGQYLCADLYFAK